MKTDFQSIIFDLDGVIINSEELHARAKRMTLNKYDIPYPESIFNDFKGRPDLDFWSYVVHELAGEECSVAGLDAYKRTVYLSLVDEIALIPGVLEFLALARKKFLHLGLVSSATLPDLKIVDEKFQIRKRFDLVILGEDTRLHKPHPEPYLKAMAGLGAVASDTIVLEDSPNGIISAKKAGCTVVGITTGFTIDELNSAGADYVVTTFKEIAELLKLAHPTV